MSDIENFLCNPVRNKGILLFPPVSKYRRFLIHKLIEESFPRSNLQTLSVGKDSGRRTAVFLRSLLRPDFKVPVTLGNQPWRQRPTAPGTPMVNKNGDKNKARTPYGGIYRPPAVRRLLDSKLDLKMEESDAACDTQLVEATPVESTVTTTKDVVMPVSMQTQQVTVTMPPAPCSSCSSEKKLTRVKRPDRQMYVPRPKRLSTKDESLPSSEHTDKSDLQPRNKVFISERPSRVKVRKKSEGENGTKDEFCEPKNMGNHLINPAEERAVEVKWALKTNESSELDESVEISSVEPSLGAAKINQPSEISYIEPSLRAVEIDESLEISPVEPSSKAAEFDQSLEVSCTEPSFSSVDELAFETSQSKLSESTDPFDSSFQTCPEASFSVESENGHVSDVDLSDSSLSIELSVPSNADPDSSNSVPDRIPAAVESTQVPVLISSAHDSSDSSDTKNNCQSVEVKSISEDANIGSETPNSSLMSFSSMSDSGDLANLIESPPLKCSTLDTSAPSEDKDSPIRPSIKERALAKSPEAVADDWELLLNENGQFFDPSLLKELEEAVGKVNISRPSCDYKEFQTVEERTSDGECIIEIYGFSSELRTHDLMNIFSPLCGKNFQIAWVDDTHALGVFPTPLIADELLSTELPFVRTRPLSEGIPESRFKARKLVLPPMTRPKTCPALARRLVTGALGLRLPTSKLEREAERKVLKEARDKKRQEAKIRRDIWEGN